MLVAAHRQRKGFISNFDQSKKTFQFRKCSKNCCCHQRSTSPVAELEITKGKIQTFKLAYCSLIVSMIFFSFDHIISVCINFNFMNATFGEKRLSRSSSKNNVEEYNNK